MPPTSGTPADDQASAHDDAALEPKSKAPPDTIVWRFNDDPIPSVPMTGGCHCGAVRFRIQHPVLARQPGYHIPVKMCDCSICQHNGYLLVFPERTDIEWLSGESGLVEYKFATQKKVHKFCGVCGSSVCMDLSGSWMDWAGDVVGINVRMLDDLDIGRRVEFAQEGRKELQSLGGELEPRQIREQDNLS